MADDAELAVLRQKFEEASAAWKAQMGADLPTGGAPQVDTPENTAKRNQLLENMRATHVAWVRAYLATTASPLSS